MLRSAPGLICASSGRTSRRSRTRARRRSSFDSSSRHASPAARQYARALRRRVAGVARQRLYVPGTGDVPAGNVQLDAQRAAQLAAEALVLVRGGPEPVVDVQRLDPLGAK
jgi:hypothetical protein